MKKLLLKIIRDIKQSKGQFIAIILIISIGAFLSASLNTLADGLEKYTQEYFADKNIADLSVFYSNINDEDISKLKEIEGINRIEGRVTFTGIQKTNNVKTELVIHSIPKDNEINKYTILEGNLPVNKDEIVLDSLYAKSHNYKIGDVINIIINEKEQKFNISGFGENVEHAYIIKDISEIYPDHSVYGVAYISQERIEDIFGSDIYNELIIDTKKGYDSEVIGDKIEELSSASSYLPKERNLGYSRIQNNIKSNGSFAIIMPLIIFSVAAVIIYLTLSRIIDSERGQIAVMKALGIENRNIIFHYMAYALIVGIVGSLIGSAIGSILSIQIGNSEFNSMYSFPDFKLKINLIYMIPSVILSFALGTIAAYFSSRKVLKENAAQAMRPNPPKKSKAILIERIPSLWTRLSYGNKIILRNIFLTKQRAVFTSCGIIVSSILLIVSFTIMNTMFSMADKIELVNKFDIRVDYRTLIDSSNLEIPNGVREYYEISEMSVQFVNDSEKKDKVLFVTEKNNSLIRYEDVDSKEVYLDDSGVIVSRTFAQKYKINEGDTIDLKFISPDNKDSSIKARVAKITEQYINDVIYCSTKYLESFNVAFKPTTLLANVNEPMNLDRVVKEFDNVDTVVKTTTISDLKDIVNSGIQQNSTITIMFAISAIILAAASIYIISSINIFDRTRELATLKVLGYQKNKINKLVFVENIMITIFSIVVSIPISYFVLIGVSKALEAFELPAPTGLNMVAVLLSILLTLAVTVISNLLLKGKVKKIDMIESLRSVE